jgi:hypothetical protein
MDTKTLRIIPVRDRIPQTRRALTTSKKNPKISSGLAGGNEEVRQQGTRLERAPGELLN